MMKNKGENLEEKKRVILQWKKLYMEALIDELRPFGDVLEVGFGHGDAANRIQSYKPSSHTIIESDPQIAKEAKVWASKHPNVSVVEGPWQTILPSLGVFDAIFLNDYPIDTEMGMMNRINPEEIKMTSDQAKELLSKLESQLTQMTVHYSDQEIEEFYKKTGQFNMKELPHFFKKLKEYGYITEKQYKDTIQKYHLEEKNSKDKPAGISQDSTFVFLDACLKNHMRKGSRFSCFSNDITSKYEDAQFFENVITNPYLDYFEKMIPIKVPKFSEHFKFDEALVIVVEKFS